MADLTQFSKPRRQSSAAIIFLLGNIFRILLKQLWVIILVVLFNPKKQMFNSFTFVFLGLAVFGALSSIIAYFNYFFYIKDGELVMEKGVLRKIKVSVPLDRIQTVNFKQGILHQMLHVTAIEIDTAGSKGNEFSLQALKKEEAEALRSYVERFKSKMASNTPVAKKEEGDEMDAPGPTGQQPGMAPEAMFRLSPMDLLKIGVSQNHLRTAGIIMVFFLGFFDDLENAFDFKLDKEIEKLLGMGKEMDIAYYILLAIPFFLFVSFLLTLVKTVLRYHGLRFWRTERGFKMVSGLFTKQEVSANLSKIQYIRSGSNPLKRAFGMLTVRLPQAASVQVGRKMAMGIPGCYGPHLAAISQAYFPDEKGLVYEGHGVSSRIVKRQLLYQGVFPVAALSLLTWSWLGPEIWIWAMWLPAAYWLSLQYHRNWRWRLSEESLRTEWGVLNRHSILLQWHKVQAVAIRQNWFLKRRGLAYLTLFTAAGAVTVPYIPLEKARAVQDYVLYKIETDGRAWM